MSDEVIGFHFQQAAEKMLKALLSDLGAAFHKTHELGALMDTLARSGAPLPGEFENLDVLTHRLVRFTGTTIMTARSPFTGRRRARN